MMARSSLSANNSFVIPPGFVLLRNTTPNNIQENVRFNAGASTANVPNQPVGRQAQFNMDRDHGQASHNGVYCTLTF